MSLRERFDKWPSMHDPYANSDSIQRDTLTKIGKVLVELAVQTERIADALQKSDLVDTTESDKEQLLVTFNSTPEYQKGSVLVVTVVEHARYRDGGTIEYRDIHNRLYVVPAPIYQKSGIYSDVRQSTWVESERLKGIELNIVQSFT